MTSKVDTPGTAMDAKPLLAEELLSALHRKFSANFDMAKPLLATATEAERQARWLSTASKHLAQVAGNSPHQRALAACLDEIFADSICAVYLAACGLHVPARMLMRRSLELGLVVTAYWDSPVDFWSWREHDADIRFAILCEYLQSDGYRSLLAHQPTVSSVNADQTVIELGGLCRELSNIVHPKTYNFATTDMHAFTFDADDFAKTLSYATNVTSAISRILAAQCSTQLVPNAKFCAQCGFKVAEGASVVSGLLEDSVDVLSISDRLRNRIRPRFPKVGHIVQASRDELMRSIT